MNAFVYILHCRDGSYDGSYYVGSARGSLETRIAQHNAGIYQGYTSTHRPVRLVIPKTLDVSRMRLKPNVG